MRRVVEKISMILVKTCICHEQNVGRKNEIGEVSDGNEEHIIAEWRRGDSC